MSVFADGMEYFTHTHTHMQTCAKFNLRMRSEYKVHFYTLIYITSFKFFQYQWVFFNSEFGILFSF